MADPDLFAGNGAIYELDVWTKGEAVETLVRKLSELGHLRPPLVDSIVAAIMHREELGSTALGRGFAVPHVEHDAIEQFVGIIGHVPGGIDLWSPDGAPVTKVFLLLSPPNNPPELDRALQQIGRYMQMSK